MDETTKNTIDNLEHSVNNDIKDLRRDIDKLENRVKDVEKEQSIQNNRIVVVEQTLLHIQKTTDEIKIDLGKFKWIIISSVVIALINLVMVSS